MEVLTLPLLHQNAVVTISDETGVGEARRTVSGMCDAAGFGATAKGKLALIATEAGNNLLRHGNGGEVLIRRLQERGQDGFELLAIDRGPGMRNVTQCLVDG